MMKTQIKNGFCIIDKRFMSVFNKHKWTISSQGYVYTNVKLEGKKKQLFLHHLVIGRKVGYETDHINRNKLDNRSKNLRNVLPIVNKWNFPKRKDNTSGYTGVVWSKLHSKFRARIGNKGKKVCLGLFTSKKKAYNAYLLAKRRLQNI